MGMEKSMLRIHGGNDNINLINKRAFIVLGLCSVKMPGRIWLIVRIYNVFAA